jgi:hypothetical protein
MHGSLFRIGDLTVTPKAWNALEAAGQPPLEFLARHAIGDWGDLHPEDKYANDCAVLDGGRILSAYHTKLGTQLWVVTEAHRRTTTILLPEEY